MKIHQMMNPLFNRFKVNPPLLSMPKTKKKETLIIIKWKITFLQISQLTILKSTQL